MIVVIGALGLRGTIEEPAADGLAAEIARAAAAAGARVELISKAGDDPAGDAVLLALAQAGVGHVATLRDPARLTPVRSQPDEPTDPDAQAGPDEDPEIDLASDSPGAVSPEAEPSGDEQPVLDAADVSLALRYLTDFEVLVIVHATPDLLSEAVAAASWTGARLVVVVEPETSIPPAVPADALVVAATADDAEGVGARIGRYAASLSRGDDAAAAYRDLTAAPGA